jgi:hypothetical protein
VGTFSPLTKLGNISVSFLLRLGSQNDAPAFQDFFSGGFEGDISRFDYRVFATKQSS